MHERHIEDQERNEEDAYYVDMSGRLLVKIKRLGLRNDGGV
jgi:hypothetical protein